MNRSVVVVEIRFDALSAAQTSLVCMNVTHNEDRKPSCSPRHQMGTSTPDSVSLRDATLPSSRRRFFRSIAADCATAVGTAYLARNSVAVSKEFIPTIERIEEREPREYPNTHTRTTFPSGRSFHNLGVVHTGLRYMLERETINRAIRAHDVVMVEGVAGQTYFDFISALAHQHGKVVLRLESGKSQIHDVGYTVAVVLALYTAVGNTLHFGGRGVAAAGRACSKVLNRMATLRGRFVDSGEDALQEDYEDRSGPTLSRTLFTLGAACNYYAFGLSEHVVSPDRERGDYPIKDHSYTMDGRTVLMLKDIERCVDEFSNLKILTITGDLHAIGFSYYTSTPERYEAYQTRVQWYERIYRSWLGGRPKIEIDPVLTGRETPAGT